MKNVHFFILLAVIVAQGGATQTMRRTSSKAFNFMPKSLFLPKGSSAGSSNLGSQQIEYPSYHGPVSASLPSNYGSLSWSEMSPEQVDLTQQAWHESQEALRKDNVKKTQRIIRNLKRIGRFIDVITKIIVLIVTAKIAELLIHFGLIQYELKIIDDIKKPGTLSYELAELLRAQNWDLLEEKVKAYANEILEQGMQVALDNTIENRLQRQLVKLQDVKNAGIDVARLVYFIAVLRVVAQHLNMSEQVQNYLIYFVEKWQYQLPQVSLLDKKAKNANFPLSLKVKDVIKTFEPQMLSFYLEFLPDQKLTKREMGIYLYECVLDLQKEEHLSIKQKECLNILLNAYNHAPDTAEDRIERIKDIKENIARKDFPDDPLDVFRTMKQKMNEQQDQRLIIKIDKFISSVEQMIQDAMALPEAELEIVNIDLNDPQNFHRSIERIKQNQK